MEGHVGLGEGRRASRVGVASHKELVIVGEGGKVGQGVVGARGFG